MDQILKLLVAVVNKIDFNKINKKNRNFYLILLAGIFSTLLLRQTDRIYDRKVADTVPNKIDHLQIPLREVADRLYIQKYDTPSEYRWFCIVYFLYDSVSNEIIFSGFNYNKQGEITYHWSSTSSDFNGIEFTYRYNGSIYKQHSSISCSEGLGRLYFFRRCKSPVSGYFTDNFSKTVHVKFEEINSYLPGFSFDINAASFDTFKVLGKTLKEAVYRI